MANQPPTYPTFKCEVCGQKSVIHLTEVVHDQTREFHLCEQHAQTHPSRWGPGSPVRTVIPKLKWASSFLAGLEKEHNVTELVEALSDNDALVRRLAAIVLGDIGDAAVNAVPALIGRLKDNDQDVREQAASALSKIDTEAARRDGFLKRLFFKLTARHGTR